VTEFTLPELGENITKGDVLRVLVKPGDVLAEDQAVIELETDKATIEVPSSVAGRVKEVKVKEGQTVNVGQVILTVDQAAGAAAPSGGTSDHAATAAGPSETVQRGRAEAEPSSPGRAEAGRATRDALEQAAEEPGEGEAAGPRAAKPAPPAATTPDARTAAREAGAPPATIETGGPRRVAAADSARPRKVVDISRGARPAMAAPELPPAPAAPSVRRMARELGVDVNQVAGTGPAGRISIEDVKAHAKRIVEGAVAGGTAARSTLPDFTRWGEVERQPLRAVRRKTAEHLSAAWATIPTSRSTTSPTSRGSRRCASATRRRWKPRAAVSR
jgi:pyruvate dehydrogenase E2 component (dihydrolipoamide acetyltransferase)